MQYLKPIYTFTRSEAEVQADIYAALKNEGFEPRLEVMGYIPAGDPLGEKTCRFDIVVFNRKTKKPLCIIECKKSRKASRTPNQLSRYQKFGLEVFMGYENNIDILVGLVKKLDAELS